MRCGIVGTPFRGLCPLKASETPLSMADRKACVGSMRQHSWLSDLLLGLALACWPSVAFPAEPPCDRYPPAKQERCTAIWKKLNEEDGPAIVQFGLAQQKRRDAGKINAEQHLGENMAFIRQMTEKRLERLKARMDAE